MELNRNLIVFIVIVAIIFMIIYMRRRGNKISEPLIVADNRWAEGAVVDYDYYYPYWSYYSHVYYPSQYYPYFSETY